MGEFEILERDGFARIGRLATPHGSLETPTLLPVLHPDPARQPVPAQEMRERFGFPGVITSAYIAWKSPELRERAGREGIHRLLQFEGPVMTDSGAFQQHAYGHVEVGPEEILEFENRIGTDIATVLDIFSEPGASESTARSGLTETTARARTARTRRPGLLAVPVQGGRFPQLRREAAQVASEIGDVLAVGGIVPLLEQYHFADLARVLIAARPALAPERVVHLFGAGHPLVFAFGALFGADLFDSSAYHKFARRGDLLFPWGTVPLDSIREAVCRCLLCSQVPLVQLGALPAAEREAHLARHNLLQCAEEIARVRQAIRDGMLWELVEQRAAAHPALQAALNVLVGSSSEVFVPAEPMSRPAFRITGPFSLARPAVQLWRANLNRWKEGKGPFRPAQSRGLTPAALRGLEPADETGRDNWWEVDSALGPVPIELSEIYPAGSAVAAESYDREETRRSDPLPPSAEAGPGRLESWTRRHVSGIFEWAFGREAARVLLRETWAGERSPRTGRLRLLRLGGDPWFMVGPDGLPRPTWKGGIALHRALRATETRIVVSEDAVPFVSEGRSLFARFVRFADPRLRPGASALLVDEADRLLAVGRLLLTPSEMTRMPRGIAVRVTSHSRASEPAQVEEGGNASGAID